MIRFFPPAYEGGRHLAVSGSVEIGAVFPPLGSDKGWRWRLWVGSAICPKCGADKTELAAKTALDREWADFLRRAGLVEEVAG